VQQRLSPIPKRSPQPRINRHTKTHLGSLQQCFWNVFVQNLTEQPFTLAVSNLHEKWEASRKLYHPVVEQRNPYFQADSHACSVDLGQDVVRKISNRIEKHHFL